MNRSALYDTEKVFTIPNMLSFLRLLLIPVMVWVYFKSENHIVTLLLLALSALTDIVDGLIARKFHLVSNLGKILDPAADKLTQAAMLFCLVFRFKAMWIPLALMVIKELCSMLLGWMSIRRSRCVLGAVWHGKAATVLLYSMMAVHLVWYNIPQWVSYLLIGICVGMMLLSFVLYSLRYIRIIRGKQI